MLWLYRYHKQRANNGVKDGSDGGSSNCNCNCGGSDYSSSSSSLAIAAATAAAAATVAVAMLRMTELKKELTRMRTTTGGMVEWVGQYPTAGKYPFPTLQSLPLLPPTPTPTSIPCEKHRPCQLMWALALWGVIEDGVEGRPTGTNGTTGFIWHHVNCGAVCTHTHHKCGVHRFGYSVGKPDLQVTCVEP